MSLTKKIEMKVPNTPNFIQVGENWIPVQNFTDKELKEIGRQWLINLLNKANKRK